MWRAFSTWQSVMWRIEVSIHGRFFSTVTNIKYIVTTKSSPSSFWHQSPSSTLESNDGLPDASRRTDCVCFLLHTLQTLQHTRFSSDQIMIILWSYSDHTNKGKHTWYCSCNCRWRARSSWWRCSNSSCPRLSSRSMMIIQMIADLMIMPVIAVMMIMLTVKKFHLTLFRVQILYCVRFARNRGRTLFE